MNLRGSRRDLLIAALAAAVLTAAMIPLARGQRLDYDEWLELHAVWQVASGHKPYADFYFARPPFSWLLWAPLLRLLPEKMESLVLLRLLNLGTSLSALSIWCWSLLTRSAEKAWKTSAPAAVALVVLQVPVVFTFAQFRPDHLALALTVAGLLFLEQGCWAVSGALMACGFLLTPKLALICAAAPLVYSLGEKRSLRSIASFIGGAFTAAAVIDGAAWLAGSDPRPLWGVLRQHAAATASAGYRFGLARGVLLRAAYDPLWVLIFAGGLYASAAELRQAGWRKNRLLVVVLAFVLVQPLWVKYFYDQYLYTVLLFWSLPLALFLQRAGRWRSKPAQAAVALLFVAGAFYGLPGLLAFEKERRTLAFDVAVGNRMLELAPRGSPVATPPPPHPVFRENSTRFIDYSVIPGARAAAEPVSYEEVRAQLDARPPSLVRLDPVFAGGAYRRAVADFVRDHPKDYVHRDALGVALLVRRPTRP